MFNSSEVLLTNTPHLMDVTLREGLYVSKFTLSEAIEISKALDNIGIPFIEIGYLRRKNHVEKIENMPANCSPQYLCSIAREVKKAKLVVMVKFAEVDLQDYQDLLVADINMVRFPCLIEQAQLLVPHINEVKKLGLKVAVNIIRASEHSIKDIVSSAKILEKIGVDCIYIADSNGSLYSNQVSSIFNSLVNSTKINLGFHAHDGLSMAFTNTLESIRHGAKFIDSSLGGIGKSFNLSTEVITAFLNLYYKQNFDLNLILSVLEKDISQIIGGGCLKKFEAFICALLNLNMNKLAQIKMNNDKYLNILLEKIKTGEQEAYGSYK